MAGATRLKYSTNSRPRKIQYQRELVKNTSNQCHSVGTNRFHNKKVKHTNLFKQEQVSLDATPLKCILRRKSALGLVAMTLTFVV